MSNKIATTKDLQTELRQLLAAAEGPNPSREKLAADLVSLAERVAAKNDDEFMYKRFQKDVEGLHGVVAKAQEKLKALDDVVSEFVSAFDREDARQTKKLAMQVYSKANAIKELVEFNIMGRVSSID